MDAIVNRQRGVSLLESLVSVILFLIIATGWLSLEASLVKTSGQSHLNSQAVFIAQSHADTLRQLPFDELLDPGDGNLLYFDAEGQELPSAVDAIFALDVNVATVTGLPPDGLERKDVTLSVTWDFYGDEFDNEVQIRFSKFE